MKERILELKAEGKTIKQISSILNISKSKVERYLYNEKHIYNIHNSKDILTDNLIKKIQNNQPKDFDIPSIVWTTESINNLIEKEHGIKIDTGSLDRFLKSKLRFLRATIYF